ncbi:MAG: tricorn protease [Actinomycetota bacterium]
MSVNAGYFRYPTIAGDTIAFVSEDDMWTVAAEGGVANRLTAGLSEESRPVLSPDGSLLAFMSREEHHAEVWVMAGGGGPARRVTWLGANQSIPRLFLPDGRILFVSDAGQPFASQLHAYAVSPDGGTPERLPFGPVREVAFGPDGGVVLGRNTADPARWKRYRGGTAGRLWIDQRGTGQFKPFLDLDGNLASPMWIGRRVYFISDHEGVGNVYSVRPDGKGLQRHSDHDHYYARFAVTDGRRVVYQHAGEVWLFDPETDEARVVEVDFRSPRVQRNRRFVPAEAFMSGYALHPDGHALAVETRGKLFTFPLWEQAVRQQGWPDGVRYKHSRWTHDGASVVTVSDEGGEDAIEVRAASEDEARRLEGLDLGRVVTIELSPTARQAAVVSHRRELFVVDLDEGRATLVDRSEYGHLGDPAWSPDGRWLAYSCALTRPTVSLKLCEVATGSLHTLTEPQYRDLAPSFDPSGDYLWFLSYRRFDPVYDSLFFDLGFPRAIRPYAMALRADLASPFVPKPRGLGAPPAPDSEPDQKSDKNAEVRIDLDGIGARIVPFPVPDGRYSQIAGIAGKVLLLSWPVEGSLGGDWPKLHADPAGSLEVYDLTEQKHDTLVGGVSSFTLSQDGTTLVYAAGSRLRALKAGEKPPEHTDHEPPGRKSGWIDLERVRVSVDPGREWAQMLDEAWRLQRDHFWVADLSGVDWDEVRTRYRPLTDKIATRVEFSDLMWEMQGELGTSHAYELGGDHRRPPHYALGFLGADLSLDRRGRWVFAHVVEGEAGDPDHNSPLRAPGVNVEVGDTLLAVGGRAVGRDLHPATLLVNQAGLAVELTVGDRSGRKPRTVVVQTVGDERPARYREWVTANRRRVHKETGGRVGYVHVPDMGPSGYAEFHRSYLSEVAHDALIVDVRFNGGGHVSSLLLEKLARRRIGYAVARWGQPEPYPEESPAGPLVTITNEQAGSDGDIFTHSFKLFGLGPVVGKRTWGGVIGINPTYPLVDGSVTTQPEYSFWFQDVGWGVENYGTDPDYDVDIKPQDHVAGRDPQMDKAIDLVMRALKRHRAVGPDVGKRPDLRLPLLPPRLSEPSGNGKVGRVQKARTKKR